MWQGREGKKEEGKEGGRKGQREGRKEGGKVELNEAGLAVREIGASM